MEAAPDFSAIDELLGGYRAAAALIASVRLGIFDALEDKPLTWAELARRLDADARGVRILCDALTALKLLEKDRESYRNSPAAARFLTASNPSSRAATVHHAAVQYARWGRLEDAVRTGSPIHEGEIDPRLKEGKGAFAAAMAAIARTSAVQTADALDLGGARRLLDVGGGPAVYAIEFARRHRELQIVVMDDAKTLETARANVAEANLAERIQLLPGDVFRDDPGSGYDVAFTSNFVHIHGEEENRRLVARCARALKAGGRLVIKDFVLGPDRVSPRWTALFAVNMLVGSESGDCYTLDQIQSWLREAGLEYQDELPVTGQSSLVVAVKTRP